MVNLLDGNQGQLQISQNSPINQNQQKLCSTGNSIATKWEITSYRNWHQRCVPILSKKMSRWLCLEHYTYKRSLDCKIGRLHIRQFDYPHEIGLSLGVQASKVTDMSHLCSYLHLTEVTTKHYPSDYRVGMRAFRKSIHKGSNILQLTYDSSILQFYAPALPILSSALQHCKKHRRYF